MKVLINAISARMGGIVTYTRNLIRSLDARGVDAHFSVSSRFPDTGANITRHWASDLKPLTRFAWEQTLWRGEVSRMRPDVLFSSANFGLLTSPVPQVLLIREGGLFDPFYLANVAPEQGLRASLQRGVRRKLILASARRAEQVITPTSAMRDLILDWAPDLKAKVEVNPYGTRSEAFTPAQGEGRAWRADGTLRLLYVSVYYPHKQPGLVCEAIRALRGEGAAAAGTITMDVGETKDFRGGAHDRFLIAKAFEDGLVDLGRRPYEALPDLYRSHDVFVFPSISETFGHPMVEAMSSGMLVVAADTPVNREVCGDAALYFDPLSVRDLVACLKRLDGDSDLRRALAERGRARVLSSYTWEAHVERLVEIFRALAKRGKGRA